MTSDENTAIRRSRQGKRRRRAPFRLHVVRERLFASYVPFGTFAIRHTAIGEYVVLAPVWASRSATRTTRSVGRVPFSKYTAKSAATTFSDFRVSMGDMRIPAGWHHRHDFLHHFGISIPFCGSYSKCSQAVYQRTEKADFYCINTLI